MLAATVLSLGAFTLVLALAFAVFSFVVFGLDFVPPGGGGVFTFWAAFFLSFRAAGVFEIADLGLIVRILVWAGKPLCFTVVWGPLGVTAVEAFLDFAASMDFGVFETADLGLKPAFERVD